MMKSIYTYFFALIAIFSLSIGSAIAEPAVVIGIEGCTLLGGNGEIEAYVGSGITVSAHSSNGNVKHTCKGDVTPPDSGRSAIWNYDNTEFLQPGYGGVLCGIDGTSAVTDDWHQVVSSSGKAMMVCHFKN